MLGTTHRFTSRKTEPRLGIPRSQIREIREIRGAFQPKLIFSTEVSGEPLPRLRRSSLELETVYLVHCKVKLW